MSINGNLSVQQITLTQARYAQCALVGLLQKYQKVLQIRRFVRPVTHLALRAVLHEVASKLYCTIFKPGNHIYIQNNQCTYLNYNEIFFFYLAKRGEARHVFPPVCSATRVKCLFLTNVLFLRDFQGGI